MTDLEKCDQLQSTVSSSTSEPDVSTLCSFSCQSPASTVTLASARDASNCTKSEGGVKANLTVLGSFIALFCTFGQINAFGTYQSWYSSHQLQRMSPSAISWIGSLQLWVFFFLVCSIEPPIELCSAIQHDTQGGFIGPIFDSHGPSGLMICGTALYFLSAICTSFSTGYQHYLLSQGVLFGVSVGFL
jgi:MFS family permease